MTSKTCEKAFLWMKKFTLHLIPDIFFNNIQNWAVFHAKNKFKLIQENFAFYSGQSVEHFGNKEDFQNDRIIECFQAT